MNILRRKRQHVAIHSAPTRNVLDLFVRAATLGLNAVGIRRYKVSYVEIAPGLRTVQGDRYRAIISYRR